MKNSDGSDFYNDRGPTYYAVPVRQPEGHWHWLVAVEDEFDEATCSGNFIAECCSLKEAQHIVRACNSHAALVEALHKADALEAAANALACARDRQERDRLTVGLATAQFEYREARAALSLARQEGGAQ